MQSTLPLSIAPAHDATGFRNTLTGKVALVVAASAFVALCAHVSVPLYFTPVPLTLQPMAVILVGLFLGPAIGFSAMVLYLAEGAIGLPVFSPTGPGGIAQLVGPTAGFLLSYPLAAGTAGALVRIFSFLRSRYAAALLAGIAATVLIYLGGAGWLAHLLHLTTAAAWRLAVAPFLPGEAIKLLGAAGIFSALQRWHRA